MPIFRFIGHILTGLFGKSGNIYKQTSSTFYRPNNKCPQNNLLRRKKSLKRNSKDVFL